MNTLGWAFFHWHKMAKSDSGFCYCSDVKESAHRHVRSACGFEFFMLQIRRSKP